MSLFFLLLISTSAAFTVTKNTTCPRPPAEIIDHVVTSTTVFVNWTANEPTVTILSDFDSNSNSWNKLLILRGIRDGSDPNIWHFITPSAPGMNFEFSRIALDTRNKIVTARAGTEVVRGMELLRPGITIPEMNRDLTGYQILVPRQ